MTASSGDKPLPGVPSITIPRIWLTTKDYTTPGPHTPSTEPVHNVPPSSPIRLWAHSLTYGFIDPTIDLDLYSPTVHTANSVGIIYSGRAKPVDLNMLANTRHSGPGQATETAHEIEPLQSRVILSPQLYLQEAYCLRVPYTSPVSKGPTGRSLRSSSGRPRVETAVLAGNPGGILWGSCMQGARIPGGLLNTHLTENSRSGEV